MIVYFIILFVVLFLLVAYLYLKILELDDMIYDVRKNQRNDFLNIRDNIIELQNNKLKVNHELVNLQGTNKIIEETLCEIIKEKLEDEFEN